MSNGRYSLILGALLACAVGCGPGSGEGVSPAPTAPVIQVQPASQTVAVGQPATFSVSATGTPPLRYQWFWNGMALNAHGLAFTTPPAAPSDDQSTLSVAVSNDTGTVTSTVATLSVPGSPRRPTLWDLRFKDVGSFPLPLTGSVYTNILGGMRISYQNQAGTPLTLGPSGPVGTAGGPRNCSWSFGMFFLPDGAVGRTTTYQVGLLSDFPSDLAAFQSPDTIITSLDLFEGQGAYAVQAVKTAGADAYTCETGTLLPADLQAAATRLGAAGRVITAVSLSGGQATYIAYGRQGDLATPYEASVASATTATLSAVAADLAQQGYLITAVGGNWVDGFLLVGTRVQGDTTPRPFQVTSRIGSDRGFAMVGAIFIYDAAMSSASYVYLNEQ